MTLHEIDTGRPFSSELITLDPRGLPVFRPQSADAVPALDLDTALRLEQDSLIQEDRCRVGLPS